MEEISVINQEIAVSRRIRTNLYASKPAPSSSVENRALKSIISEGGESFFNYVSWLGFDNDPNLLVLSSKHHYYYDVDELRGITTLVTLKKLNMMKHLNSFLHVVCNILTPGTTFVGCFTDSRNRNEGGISSRIYKKFINFIDDRTDIEISRKELIKIFESYGMRIIDMTEVDGITYFTTRKFRRSEINEA
jgi:hypothetical protein